MPRYPEHLRTFADIGPYRHFLTFCARDRRDHFSHGETVALIRSQSLRAASEIGFAVIAYCFMPDHVHLLVEGRRDDADLRWFIKQAKQLSGFYFRRHTGAHLWQRHSYQES